LYTTQKIELTNPKNLSRKIVIDVTNPLDYTNRMPPTLAIGHQLSHRNDSEIVDKL